jgi:hypothetical protein
VGVMDLIRRADKSDGAMDELQAGMSEALDANIAEEIRSAVEADMEDLELPVVALDTAEKVEAEPRKLEAEQKPEAERREPETEPSLQAAEAASVVTAEAPRLTAYAQSRLAALESFEKLHRDTQEYLQQIEGRLAEITTSQQLTRRFFTILHGDIRRTNEFELANVAHVAEQKRLGEQVGELTRKLQERDATVETLRQRETSLGQDNEQLRASLAAVKMELVESTSSNARNEAKLGEAIKTLSGQTVEAERRARENELLREKQVSLQIELDKAHKREAEAQRTIDEMTDIHANETAQHAELVAALGKSEKEVSRLQLAIEAGQMKQAEMTEAALIVAGERESDTQRMLAEMGGLREEIQVLQARIEAAGADHAEALSRISGLKAQLSDANSARQVVDEKLASLMKEHEQDRMHLSAATANISQLSLQQETEQIQLDIHRQECEDLRAEIATLNQRIMELLPFERLYKASIARQAGGGSNGNSGSSGSNGPNGNNGSHGGSGSNGGSAALNGTAEAAAIVAKVSARPRNAGRRTPASSRGRVA